MSRLNLSCALIIGMAFCISVASASAAVLTATSTSEAFDDGAGGVYYKYTIDLQWDFSDATQNDMSHWAVDLNQTLLCPFAVKDEFGQDTGSIWFEQEHPTYIAPSDGLVYPYISGIDGISTSETSTELEVLWLGLIDLPPAAGNGVKYEQPLLYDSANPTPPVAPEPGNTGNGQFWFYSIFAPTEVTEGIITAKADNFDVDGSISGSLPYCIPEPATLMLLTLGGLMIARKRG